MFNTKIFENTGSSGSTTAMNIPVQSEPSNTNSAQPQPIDITFNHRPSVFNNSRFSVTQWHILRGWVVYRGVLLQ